MKKIDPKEYDLPTRTILEQVDDNTVAIVINRKTRVIMADGKKIIEKAQNIQNVQSGVSVALKTSAPVCGKTIKFLEGEGIRLILAE